MSDVAVDRRAIVDELWRLGVARGGLLLVHSSLSAFGHVRGGAEAVVDSLLEAIGENGSLFVPSFNYGQLVYDPATTPSLTGAVSEAVRRRVTARRSLHPTHPISGIGIAAAQILAEHSLMHPFGQGSPLWQLWERNAQVLLLGCDQRANSMIHVAEEAVAVPYLNRMRIARMTQNGAVRELTVRRPPCSMSFGVIDTPLRERGQLRETTIGNAHIRLMLSADIVNVVTTMLRKNAAVLLCNDPACEFCKGSRDAIAAQEKRGEE